jgi:alkanesulfonate monooxygenase SsuD/methylene tetrahydromethanopterin reductase-like flavin-dependent oxidoreductase (luciferase family)
VSVSVGVSVWSGLGDATVPYLDAVAAPYDSLWFPDHLQTNEVGVMEGWTMLAYCLARFPDKVCGHQVLCNEFRPPSVLAKMAASAQVMSGGRLVLGIGAGWHRDEAAAYGLDFPSTPVRVARMSESISLIRRLWTGEPVTFEGEHYRLDGAECLPAPDPEPPIMIGGSGEKYLLAAVAEHADRWNFIFQDPDELTHKLAVLQRHCDRIGRDPGAIEPVLGTQVLIAENSADLARLQADDQVRSVARNGIAGTAEQVTDVLGRGIAAGAKSVIVGFADSPRPDGAELFARDVLPALRAL